MKSILFSFITLLTLTHLRPTFSSEIECNFRHKKGKIILNVFKNSTRYYSTTFGAGGAITGFKYFNTELIPQNFDSTGNKDVDHVHQVTMWNSNKTKPSNIAPIHPATKKNYLWNINQAGRNDNKASDLAPVVVNPEECQVVFYSLSKSQYKMRNIGGGNSGSMNRFYQGRLKTQVSYSVQNDGALLADFIILPEKAKYKNNIARKNNDNPRNIYRWFSYQKFMFIHWMPFDSKKLSSPCYDNGFCLRRNNHVTRFKSNLMTMRLKSGAKFSLIFPNQTKNGIRPIRIKRKNTDKNTNMVLTLGYDNINLRSSREALSFKLIYLPQLSSQEDYLASQSHWKTFFSLDENKAKVLKRYQVPRHLKRNQYKTGSRISKSHYVLRNISRYKRCVYCKTQRTLPY